MPTQPLPPIDSTEGTVKWPNGQVSFTMKFKNRDYIRVNGLVAPASYERYLEHGSPVQDAAVKQQIADGLNSSLSKLEEQLHEEFLGKEIVAEAGYYSMWIPYSEALWTQLQAVTELPVPMTLEAVTSNPKELQRVKEQSAQLNKLIVAGGAKDKTDGFSGLVRIGVTNEWLSALDAELGERADGSNVKVGITDTGITYNHPSYLNAAGTPRIAYMKDFTQEGKVYFPNTAKFSVRLGTADEATKLGVKEENLLFAEDVSGHVNPVALTPAADGPNLLAVAKGSAILVPADVRKAVQDGASVRLGFLAEFSYYSAQSGTSFDLNRNGKIEDLMGLVLVSPKGSTNLADAKAYVNLDAVGTLSRTGAIALNKNLDLSKAIALRDFNASKDIAQSFAEKFGLAFESLKLKTADGTKDVDTVVVGIVGYDSGMHGSHVAGIIGGRKTILNDSDLTLARGVAPNTQLYSERVCANTRGCSASNAIIDLALNAKVDVINMSLGGLSNVNDGYDTQSLLIDRLSQITNTQFIISAGNEGPGLQTVGSPSTARLAVSVAASASTDIMGRQSQISVPTDDPTKDQDFLLGFSSRGPLSNAGFKPNVTAPGTQLSAVSLNKAGRPGTEIMQGTSMAAPTVTGAYALLLDAARRYNKKHPEAQLPTDNLTLRKVLIGSAKPFDARTLDVSTGKVTQGQYTWIDQGTGIVSVPAAWEALKQLAKVRISTGINVDGKDIQPIYEVRSIMTNRYGKVYDGKPVAGSAGTTVSPYGAGLWIDARQGRPLYSVGVARRLPLVTEGTQTFNQQGTAHALLGTSGEFFKLKTEIHGSDIEWLKVNTLAFANSGTEVRCDNAGANENYFLMGMGALDASSISGTAESVIYVCVDREKLAKLPKGDHGALIRAYRTNADGTQVENVPAFIIPVYMNLPHETLTNNKSYTVTSGKVKALGISRNYVEVPADVSSMRVTLSVNKATMDASGQAQNCSGVYLNVLGADNTVIPDQFAEAVAYNCTGSGYSIGVDEELRSTFTTEIVAPKAGTWDMHVEGISRYPNSTYQLRVDYVKASTQQKEVRGNLDALNGFLSLQFKESSLKRTVNNARSTYILDQATQTVNPEIKQDMRVEVPNNAGQVLRTYPADVTTVAVATGGATGSDIDLEILECSLTGDACTSAASSGGATDEEAATFVPKAGKAYKFAVDGYAVLNGTARFLLNEQISFAKGAVGTITAQQLGEGSDFWSVGYTLNKANPFFQADIFKKDPTYEVRGSIRVASDDLTLAVIPVQIKLN